MKNRIINAVLIASIIHLTAAAASGAGTRWNRITPKGAGFSVEAPGHPQPAADSGEFAYSSGLWFLSVKLQPVDPSVQQLLGKDRKAAVKCLESIRDSVVGSVSGMRRTNSSITNIDGHPSLRFSLETEELEGTNLIVLTGEHLYLVMTVGPKGTSNADAKRFLGSFRLVPADRVPPTEPGAPTASMTNPVAAKLAVPMLTVARLITEEKMNPLIDQVLQNAPTAARLGNRWSPSNEAWQRARTSMTGRIDRIVEAYDKSGEVGRTLEAEFQQLTPESQAVFVEALNGPAGPAIVRQLARSQFATMIMSDDPNGPKPGERAWLDKLRALQATFDERAGSGLARDDGRYAADVEAFFARPSSDVSRLCFAVVAKATRQLEGAINLKLFDDRDAIGREIDAAISGVK